MALPLSLRFAGRELRGGVAGFRIFLACLTLGVAAIAGVGSLATAIHEGMGEEGAALLGGDVEVRLLQRQMGAEERDFLSASGRLSDTMQMRVMAYQTGVGQAEARRSLVELKGVDGAYPLYGELGFEPPRSLAQVTAFKDGHWGAAVEPVLLSRFDLAPGDNLRIGDLEYRIRAILVREPDRGASVFRLGPRVLVARASFAHTGLVRPGSMVGYHTRLALPPGASPTEFRELLAERFPDTGWRLRDRENASPGVARFIDRMSLFLTLIGLAALVVGGVGVANAVRGHLESRTETIATLKCLGATGGLIFRVYLIQIMALAVLGVVAGLLLGGVAPLGLAKLVVPYMPVPVKFGLYWGPLALAAAYGLLTAFAFAVWPLGRARDVPPSALYREAVAPVDRKPRAAYGIAAAVAVLALAGLAVATAGRPWFAGWFVIGVAASFAVLRGAAWGVIELARRARRRGPLVLRHAVAELCRPGGATPSMVLSLGLGLSLIVAVALIEGNLRRQVEEQIPERAPAFFFVDIQADQIEPFLETARAVPGTGEVISVPSLRGRIVRINGVRSGEAEIDPDSRWAVRGDRVFTYRADIPKDNRLTAGAWWPAGYAGAPLISLDAEIADGFGVGLGDTLTVNVMGREITATIASLREIEWDNLNINHIIIFSPGTLEDAPHTHMATAEAEGAAEEDLFRAITDRFANITVIRIKEALETAERILSQVAAAARGAAAATLVAGVLVLAGAVAAGHRRKVYGAVVLKVLGATRRDIMGVYCAEYALLGAVTAVIAAAIGTLAAWSVVTLVWEGDWVFLPLTVALLLGLSLAVTVALGLAGTSRALKARPAPVLRAE